MELIVNVTQDWGIGFENQLLISIRADLRRFRTLTEGKTVILGRKTLQTFPGGRPLKNRTNVVLTTDSALDTPGAVLVHSKGELFSYLRTLSTQDVCVIGGASVYRLLLDYCAVARVTKTDICCKADAYFPNLDEMENWRVAAKSEVQEENGLRFQYIDYVNSTPKELPTV